MTTLIRTAIAVGALLLSSAALAQTGKPGKSPWGPDDEIGALNRLTESSVLEALKLISSGKVYDLSVEYFVGMPSYDFNGQPRYQIWNVHTPQGTIVDNTTGLGDEVNELITYSGSAISMYAHTGTHVDALAHYGIRGKIWNGFESDKYLGDRGWRRGGVENYPPIIARGVMLDIAALKEVDMLPPGYGITAADIDGAIKKQGLSVREGDVVMVRTGRMQIFDDRDAYMKRTPGLTRESSNHLADMGVIMVGADNISTDVSPSTESPNYIPVHSSMLTERGVPIMQNVFLEELASDGVDRFVWIGAPLKFRGADGGPMRPIAIPIR